MNVHERFITTLNHEEPDRVPTFVQIYDPPFIRNIEKGLLPNDRILHSLSPRYFRRNHYFELNRYLGVDSVYAGFNALKIPSIKKPRIPLAIRKKFGWNPLKFIISSTGQVEYWNPYWYHDGALKTPELLQGFIDFVDQFEMKSPQLAIRFKKMWDMGIKKGVLYIPIIGSIAYNTWSSIGINRFSYMMRHHLDLVKKWAIALGRLALMQQTLLFEHGIDIVLIGEDYAFKDRMIFSPVQFEQIIEPVYKMLTDHAHTNNAKFIVHTDGNILDSFPSLIRAGVDAIEPLEYESGIRLGPLKEKYGQQITFIGNVPATDILTFGNVEQTIEFTKQCLREIAPGGGYILGAGSDILGTCKVENVKAMFATVKKYGTYPIQL